MDDLESNDKKYTLVPEHEETKYHNTVCPKCNVTCHRQCTLPFMAEGGERF